MSLSNWIVSDQNVLLGKPVVRGTRISVEFILGLMAEGWNEGQILAEYPQLSNEGIRAALEYATQLVHEERRWAVGD